MTLIVSVCAANTTVQTVDRKITEGNINKDYDEDKLILCRCADAHFSIAYTGAAFVHNQSQNTYAPDVAFSDEEPTARWVADVLVTQIRLHDSVDSVLKGFEEAVGEAFDGSMPTMFVIMGYRYVLNDVGIGIFPLCGTISNFVPPNNTFAKTGGEFMNENRAFGSKL